MSHTCIQSIGDRATRASLLLQVVSVDIRTHTQIIYYAIPGV